LISQEKGSEISNKFQTIKDVINISEENLGSKQKQEGKSTITFSEKQRSYTKIQKRKENNQVSAYHCPKIQKISNASSVDTRSKVEY
jgi:hypothetical protein